MPVDSSSLRQEIQQIQNNGAKPVHFAWRAEIKANGRTIACQKVLNIDIERLYDANIADRIIIEVILPLGTYMNRVFPYKDDLLMTLYKTPAGETGSAVVSQDLENHQMRATLIDARDHRIEGNHPVVANEEDANLSDVKKVSFQLVDLALEQIRMKSVGGILRKVSPGEAIRFFMTAISQDLDVPKANAIKGVDMVEPSNKAVRDHVIIPHGMQFTDVPGWIHQHMGGVYNGGFGFYLQNGYWYVYPLYNVDRWKTTPRNLTLINLPKNEMPASDRTYRKTNNQLIVLLTGENKHVDDTEKRQLNEGNGVRFTDATSIVEGFGAAKGNKYAVSRSKNNTEFVADPRKTGLNNVRKSPRGITANMFYELGKLARRQGSHLMAVWENSDPGSIYPGMPVKYICEVNGALVELYGTLLRAHHYIGLTDQGMTGNTYVCNTALTVFLDNGAHANAA